MLDETSFGAASVRMLDLLTNFAAWRAEERFEEAGLGPAADQFNRFWPAYASAKSTALHHEIECVAEELTTNRLAIVAPWVYVSLP